MKHACRDIERALSDPHRWEAVRQAPPVLNHLRGCSACRRLVSWVTTSGPFAPPPAELMRSIEQRIIGDLGPVKPLGPRYRFAAGLAVIFAAVVGVGAWRLRRLAWGAMDPWACGAILLALGLSALLLISSLVRQMTPGSRYRIRPALLLFGVLIALAGLFSSVLPRRPEADFWSAGWVCLACGLAFFAPATLSLWWFLRRGAILSARLAGVTVGMLAGLSGTTVLEIHCPLQSAWHVVTWHLGVPLVGTLICLAATALWERREWSRLR